MSQRCQYRKYRTRRCGVGRSSGTILFSRSIRQTRNGRMDASAMGCEAKAAFLAGLGAKYRLARASAVNPTSRSLCRTGAMPPHDLGSAANAF